MQFNEMHEEWSGESSQATSSRLKVFIISLLDKEIWTKFATQLKFSGSQYGINELLMLIHFHTTKVALITSVLDKIFTTLLFLWEGAVESRSEANGICWRIKFLGICQVQHLGSLWRIK